MDTNVKLKDIKQMKTNKAEGVFLNREKYPYGDNTFTRKFRF